VDGGGSCLSKTPAVAGVSSRSVDLASGEWFDFWSENTYSGGQTLSLVGSPDIIPVFVKADTLLPLARPSLHAGESESSKLCVRVYGDGSRPFRLYDDDDQTLDAAQGQYNRVVLSWERAKREGHAKRFGSGAYRQYEIVGWQPGDRERHEQAAAETLMLRIPSPRLHLFPRFPLDGKRR
jgi:alpha-D-xyloside xylohydrolase